MDKYSCVQRISLSSHTDVKGIFELIYYVSPKVVSVVHRGTGAKDEIREFTNSCKKKFSNDILCRDIKANRCDKIFDMYEWFMRGVNDYV